MKILKRIRIQYLLIGVSALLLSSCNKDFDNRLIFESDSDTTSTLKTRKVLYLIIDGARGKSFNGSHTPTIANMSENSVFTYNGVSDEGKLSETSWADMLTGVEKDKHGVVSSDFENNRLAQYPMFFEFIKENRADVRTAAFLSTNKVSEKLVTASDKKEAFNGDDEAVKNAVIDELKRKDATIVLAEFNSVDQAGGQFGYDVSVNEYRQALSRIDAHINEIMTALKQRNTFDKEDWLVVVASNKGGYYEPDDQENDDFLQTERNCFLMFHNPRFEFRYLGKPGNSPYKGHHITFKDKEENTAIYANIPDDEGLYKFGANDEFTIQFKLKVFTRSSSNTSIFNKNGHAYYQYSSGWQFMIDGNNRMRFLYRNGSNSLAYLYASNEVPLKTWQTYAVRVYKEGSARKASIFRDGVKLNTLDAPGSYFDNNDKLTIGIQNTSLGTIEYTITDICIWNTAVSESFLASSYCRAEQLPEYRYYDNLIGYWPATEDEGDKIYNKSPKAQGKDFVLKNDFKRTAFNDLQDNLCVAPPEKLYKSVPRGVDVPIFIYKWLHLNTVGLTTDGKFYKPAYTDVK